MKNKDRYLLAKKICLTRPSRKSLMLGFVFSGVIIMILVWFTGGLLSIYNEKYQGDESMLNSTLIASQDGYYMVREEVNGRTRWGFAFNNEQKNKIINDKPYIKTFRTALRPSKTSVNIVNKNMLETEFSGGYSTAIVDYSNADARLLQSKIYPKIGEVVVSKSFAQNAKISLGDIFSLNNSYNINLDDKRYVANVKYEDLAFGISDGIFIATIPILENYKIVDIIDEDNVIDILLPIESFDNKYMPTVIKGVGGNSEVYDYVDDCIKLANECVSQGKYFPFLLNSQTLTSWTPEIFYPMGEMWEYQFNCKDIKEVKAYGNFIRAEMVAKGYESRKVSMIKSQALNNEFRIIEMYESMFYTIIMFLLVIGAVVLILSVLNYYVTLKFMLQSKKRFYNMLKIIGIDDKDFKAVLYMESAIVLCKALLISIIVAAVISWGMFIFINKIVFMGILTFEISLLSFIWLPITFVVLSAVYLLLAAIILRMNLNKDNKDANIKNK